MFLFVLNGVRYRLVAVYRNADLVKLMDVHCNYEWVSVNRFYMLEVVFG